MRGTRTLADRVQRGLGASARRIGVTHEVYRPRTAVEPLAVGNRVLTLPAAFDVPDGAFRRSPPYAEVFWQGVFDAGFTLPGDYLVGPSGTFFIANQPAWLPAVCVRTNRIVSVCRPAPHKGAGASGYGGVLRASVTPVLQHWPAAVVMAGTRLERSAVGLPGDGGDGSFIMLLPETPIVARVPMVADLVADEVAATYVVGSVELSAFGWRLLVRQVNS